MNRPLRLFILSTFCLSLALVTSACASTAPADESEVEVEDGMLDPAWTGSIFRYPNLKATRAVYLDSLGRIVPDCCSSEAVRLTFTVTNDGAISAGPFRVSITGGPDVSVSGLAPGASTPVSLQYSPGGYRMAVVDVGEVVFESNENDNRIYCICNPIY